MSLSITYSGSHRQPRSHFRFPLFMSGLYRSWKSYKSLRELESYPHDMLKDVGYPAAERINEL